MHVNEVYEQYVLPMNDGERLKLAARILNDLSNKQPANGVRSNGGSGKLSDLFGTVSLGYPTGLDNERIDADLAHEYGNNHENE
jgi:hypothetical protein